MANHDNHSNPTNQKPVSFLVPMILGAVIVIIILLLANISDTHSKCECTGQCSKECMEACERGEKPLHNAEAKHEESKGEISHEENTTETMPADTTSHTTEAEHH